MTRTSIILKLCLTALLLAIFGGCATQNVRIDKEYLNRVSQAKLEFAPVYHVQHITSVRANEYKEVPQHIKDVSDSQARTILQELPSSFSPVMIYTAQDRSGLSIMTEGDAEFSMVFSLHRIDTFASDAYAKLSPLEKYEKISSGNFNPINADHQFAYGISLKDNKTGKEIWAGNFSLWVPDFSNPNESEVNFAKSLKEFATGIAVALDRSGLIRK